MFSLLFLFLFFFHFLQKRRECFSVMSSFHWRTRFVEAISFVVYWVLICAAMCLSKVPRSNIRYNCLGSVYLVLTFRVQNILWSFKVSDSGVFYDCLIPASYCIGWLDDHKETPMSFSSFFNQGARSFRK